MYYISLDTASISEVLKTYFQQMSDAQINMIIVGANNGDLKDFLTDFVHYKNVHGILVEPVPHLFKALKKKFARAKNLSLENCALDKRTGIKTIYRVQDNTDFPEWSKGLGSFNKKVILGHENQVRGLRKHVIPEKVKCITFNSLIKKYRLEQVNLLQIDTEGHDFEIIKSIDFKKVRPDIIIVEYMHITFYQYFAMITLLMDNNYRVNKSHNSFDLIAVDEEIL